MGKPKPHTELRQLILSHFAQHTRPLSLKQLLNTIKPSDSNLKNSSVENSLHALVQEKLLCSKLLNNQHIYWPTQKPNDSSRRAEIDELDAKIQPLQSQFNSLQDRISATSLKLKELDSLLPTNELDSHIENLQKTKQTLLEQLKRLEGQNPISQEVKSNVEKVYKTCRDNWRKRKRLYLDIEEVFVENLGKAHFNSVKEDIGIEPDLTPFNEDATSKLLAASEKQYSNSAPSKKIFAK
ncbi:uncharacterized protein LOC126315355 [Schistocerca gregaria]|uniref:uncharacterized protein LOC126315355 n=1 Tax=Schistocerca gregaria TaxID=7010 RepID=UPI00211F43B0|nr:uncharacterized protein LOC126315355 [Schistocerca gregaria]